MLKVLFVAAELAPLAKVGGLADVAGSLPKALKKLGVDIRIAIPKYKIIDPQKYPMKRIARKIKVFFEGREEFFDLYFTFLPKTKIPVYLVNHPKYLGGDGIYYSKDALPTGTATEAHRFIFFTKAVSEILKPLKWEPDIFHCHDWHGALPLLVEIKNREYRTLLTIHNFAYQGSYDMDSVLKMLNLTEKDWPTFKTRDQWGNFNSLQQGILNADLINTVSPTYAKEILTKEYGCGLEETLKERKKDLFGILNGIDTDVFNPETDPKIFTNYNLSTLNFKALNKIHLQKISKLSINSQIPLLGLISRLAEQKGIDLIIEIFEKMMQLDLQFILLGVGDPNIERILKEKAKRYSQKFSLHLKFDAELAQQIYAGSDIFLMPSRFEPCGLGQMISMRYGTIPLVRETGGLSDTVTPTFSNSQLKVGTGFVFKEYKANELLKTIKKASKIYQNKKVWLKLMTNAMKQDFSWHVSAKKYLQLYKKLIAI